METSAFRSTSFMILKNNTNQHLDWKETLRESLKLQEKRASRRPALSREIEFCALKKKRKTVGDCRKCKRGKKWPQTQVRLQEKKKKKTSREAICDALFSRIPKGQDKIQIYCWKTPHFCRMFCDFDGSMFMN